MQPTVYAIPLDLPGRLWIMPRPKAEWLAAEIAACFRMGMTKVISLLPDEETYALGLAEQAALCRAQGIGFRNFPTSDFSLALDAVAFGALARVTLEDLRSGEGVGIHCRAGIGRSGMLACSVLAYYGLTADEAMARVSTARGLAVPDTDAQADFIRDLATLAANGTTEC